MTARTARTVKRISQFVPRLSRYETLTLIAVGFGLGIIGPFGTFLTEPLWFRVPYFITSMMLSYWTWKALENAVNHLFRDFGDIARPVFVIVPFSMINSAYLVLAHQIFGMWMSSSYALTWIMFFVTHMILSFFSIVPAIVLIRRAVLTLRTETGENLLNFLNEKLPLKLRGAELYAVQAEDHYVRVFTSRGDDLVHMAFSDALASLKGYKGMQTHRSWWVARTAILDLKPSSKGLFIRARNDIEIPVSRRRRSEFKAWLSKDIVS